MAQDSPETRLTGLVARYRHLVRAVIARVGGRALRNREDDVEQHVWVALWRRVQGEQEIDHPASYMYTVARREAIRAVKDELERQRRAAEEPAALPASDVDPHRLAEARESGDRIRRALARLSPDRRRAIQAHLSGLDVNEIMDLFGWPYDRARNLIARGRADLRELLREEKREE